MDFNIKRLFAIELGGNVFWITETIRNTWIIMAVLILVAIVVRIRLSKFETIPTGFQNVIEAIIEAFDNFVRSCVGDKLMYLGNWYFMVFFFILFSNLSGLLGMRPPTADWATTFAFALVTFILIQTIGLIYHKGKYIKGLFEPFPVFFPLNVLGELARPISLSFRLFGNVLGGAIVMALIYSLAPVYARFVIPAALHAYFDVFAGVLQTYIFCVLSLNFIGIVAMDEA